MSSIIYNQIVRPPGTATDDHLHDGVNTQSRIVCIAVDIEGNIDVYHTLTFHPKWVQLEEARGPLSPNPIGNTARVFSRITETFVGGVFYPHFDVGGVPLSGTGTVGIYSCGPQGGPGTTDYIYFTMHLGRTQSHAK